MIRFVDNLLDRITMYRLVLYYLIFLNAAAILLSVRVLDYDPIGFLFSIGFLIAVCSITNGVFAKAFAVPANVESPYISALILALIITPLQTPQDLWFFGWAGVLAMASKYIVAINQQHIFNPVAFAVALTSIAIDQSASWWVGNSGLLPFVLIGGILIVRKMRKFNLVFTFLLTAFTTIVVLSLLTHADLYAAIQEIIYFSPLFFFACIFLTAPSTTPPTRKSQMIYSVMVGFLFVPQIHLGDFYFTPELAILIGNIFSYLVSPQSTRTLKLERKVKLAPDTYDFIFSPTRKLAFAPGQYMEWTLGHAGPDSRGNRRYFTLASSPTEDRLRFGIKFHSNSSSFKQALIAMDESSEIVASQLAGDFILPADPKQRCVFIAGGIGITPFRSMIKYLLDTAQPRPIVLFYVNQTVYDIVYQDVFDQAQERLGIQTIYIVTDKTQVPAEWQGKVGYITPQLIKDAVPEYDKCTFYISGPKGMIDSFKEMLRWLHVKDSHIKTDLFAGLA